MKYLQPRYVKVEAFMIVSDFSDHLGYRGLQDHKKNSIGTGNCIFVAMATEPTHSWIDCLNEPAGRLLLVVVVSLTLCNMSWQPVVLVVQGDQIGIQRCNCPDGGSMDKALLWIGA